MGVGAALCRAEQAPEARDAPHQPTIEPLRWDLRLAAHVRGLQAAVSFTWEEETKPARVIRAPTQQVIAMPIPHRRATLSGKRLRASAAAIAATALGLSAIAPSHAGEKTSAGCERAASCVEAGSRRIAPPRWSLSGVRDRKIVRSMLDCPCPVIVRSFRSKRSYECPC